MKHKFTLATLVALLVFGVYAWSVPGMSMAHGGNSGSNNFSNDFRFRGMMPNFNGFFFPNNFFPNNDFFDNNNFRFEQRIRNNNNNFRFERRIRIDNQNVFSSVSLNGMNEVPANSSPATGVGNFAIDTVNNNLFFDVSYWGLLGSETGAHIHGPAMMGQNAGILFTLPLGMRKIGTWNYPEWLENDILNGRTYVNVHSTVYPNGEIRGQIQ